MSDFLHIDCDCSHPAHTMRFRLDPKDEPTGFPTEIIIDYQLRQYPGFWKRLLNSFHYVFCGRAACVWDSTIVNKEDAEKLKSFFDKALSNW